MKSDQWTFVASILLGLTAATAYAPLMEFVDNINQRYVSDLTIRGEKLGMKRRHLDLLMRWWWGLVIVVWLVLAISMHMIPVAFVVSGVMLTMPRTCLSWANENRRIRLRDQMVSVVRLLTSQYRAGLSDTEGLRAVALETPDPMGRELKMCVQEADSGVSLRDTLTILKDRINIDVVTIFVLTLLTCKATGGKVTDAMENISRSLQELQRVERKRESDTAGGRTLVLVLAAFPIGLGTLLWLIDPVSMGMVFSTLMGQFILSAIILMTYGAIRWAYWLISALE